LVRKKPEKKSFGRSGPPRGYPKDPSVYADPENWRYPLHTSWHAKAARRYFDDSSNRAKYSGEEQEYIDSRINQAVQKFGTKTESTTSHKRPSPIAPKRTKLEELSLEQLLRLFIGGPRLQRAREIDDSLVSLPLISEDGLTGTVKEYTVRVDMKNRTITHDCQDWRKNMDSKNMCKHLGKFFLSLDERRATDILRQVLKEKEQWSFNAPPDNQAE
jgi:hypothetical protein